jgi:uncharacterized protein YebE (UPF0316 family)
MTDDALLTALIIFALRVFNMSIGTIRMIIANRGERVMSSALAFIEALAFIYSIAQVTANLNNVPNMLAYCGGFAVGNYVGILLEQRFFVTFVTVNIISRFKGHEIAEALRAAGYGVTETTGEGREGAVTILRSMVSNRNVPQLLSMVQQIHSEAFVAVEPARPLYRGWLGTGSLRE